jgi:hypothetical protein
MKLSLRALFGWVALAALIIAAMAQPSLLWMRVMFTLALGFVACAAAGAILSRGKQRAFWTGAALCSTMYLVAVLHVSHGQIQGRTIFARSLLTQHVLDAIARGRGMHVRSEFDGFELWDEAMFRPEPTGGGFYGGGMGGFGGGMPGMMSGYGGSMMGGAYAPGGSGYGEASPDSGTGAPSLDPAEAAAEGETQPMPSDSSGAGSAMSPPGYGGESGYPGMGPPGAMAPTPGTPLPPPAPPVWQYASYNHFVVSGHCAFVVLLGIAGGFVTRALFGREESPS